MEQSVPVPNTEEGREMELFVLPLSDISWSEFLPKALEETTVSPLAEQFGRMTTRAKPQHH